MYKSNRYYTLIILGLLAFTPIILVAQDEKSDCVIKLEQAQTKYNQGRIQDIEGLIGDCLKNKGFEKADNVKALKLLTLSYLFLEEPEKAEETMLELLKTEHELAVNPAIDPSEFINLYEKYRNEPIFSVGGHLGVAFASPIITHLNGTQDLNNESRQSYAPLLGIRFGLNIEYKFKPRLYVIGGFNFQIIEFEKTHTALKIISGTENGGFEGAEEITSLEMPLMGLYHLMEKEKFTLYAGLGIAPQFLISETYQSDATTFSIEGSGSVTTGKVNITPNRGRFNLSALGVVGAKIKIGEGYLNVKLRYSQQVINSSKPESSLTPAVPNLLWDLTEAYDGFRLQDVGLSVGYTHNIYLPKKLR